jgi:hypothetical protein
MAATVTIRRWTGSGGGPTKTDITGSPTRLSTSDDPNPGSANPIPIPASGVKRSYWASTRLSADTSPAGTIDNLRWYTDGANGLGTGVTMNGQTATSYVQATGTPGDSGTELTEANHAGLTAAPVNVFTFTEGGPKAVSGDISNPSTGDFGDFMVFQIEAADTASPGVTPSETFTWKYDET